MKGPIIGGMRVRSRWRVGLAVLAVVLLVAAWLVEGGEVLLLLAGCFTAGLAVVAPVRPGAVLAVLAASVALGFTAGSAAGSAECTGEGDDCPPALLGGLLGATAGVVLAGVVVLAVRRRDVIRTER
jgi:hypothetical protein